MKHVMFDLETMGTTPRSQFITAGAVKFDPGKNMLRSCGNHSKGDDDQCHH